MTPAVTSLRSHHRHCEYPRIKNALGSLAGSPCVGCRCWLPEVSDGCRSAAGEDKPEFSSWESLPVNVSATSVARMPTREQARVGNEGSA